MYPRTLAPNNLRTVRDAAANDSDKSWTVPNDEIWRLLWASVTLVSTATVGNRQIAIVVSDASSNVVLTINAGAVQAASATVRYLFFPGVPRETSVAVGELRGSIPADLYLPAGYSLRVYDSAAVDAAADDMTVAFQVERDQTSPAYSTS